MRPALDVIWETLHDWYNGMISLAVMNLGWLVASLTVIGLPPATAGLYTVTHSVARGTGARWADYAAGARAHILVSYQWTLANIAAGLAVAVGISFYGSLPQPLGAIIQLIVITAGLLWLIVQFYVWPFLIVQEDKRLSVALKNSLFLALANPVYTLLMLSMVGLALVFSVATILPLAIFATSFISLLGNRAVVERLTAYEKLPDSYPNSGDKR